MNNLSSRLLDLKERNEQAERSRNRIEGEINQIKDGLKKQFGVSSISKAEFLLKKKIMLKEKKEKNLKKEIEVLETKYYANS